MIQVKLYIFFFFNDTATTEIYTLSLHDALPIYFFHDARKCHFAKFFLSFLLHRTSMRSEEHTSELQSRRDLVCRLLLEKKKITTRTRILAKNTRPPTPLSSRRRNVWQTLRTLHI